jgi:hypothetical protein
MTPEAVFEISQEDEHELKRLLSLLESAEGFQLRAARCELPNATEAYIRWLESRSAEHGREIVTIDLTMNETKRLHEAIQVELAVRFPAGLPPNLALMVMGLEWSIVLDDAESPAVLQNLCIERENAWQELPYSLVLWLPSYALKQLAKLDSDFSAWGECVYEFTHADDSTTAFNINQTDEDVHEVIRLLERLGAEFSAFGGNEILETVKPIYRNWLYRVGGSGYGATENRSRCGYFCTPPSGSSCRLMKRRKLSGFYMNVFSSEGSLIHEFSGFVVVLMMELQIHSDTFCRCSFPAPVFGQKTSEHHYLQTQKPLIRRRKCIPLNHFTPKIHTSGTRFWCSVPIATHFTPQRGAKRWRIHSNS